MSAKINFMRRILVSEFFFLDEFLDKESYSNLLKLIQIAEFIRKDTGKPVLINNYNSGGSLGLRGFRPMNCNVGAPMSQHKFMNAIDINIGGMSNKEMFEYVKSKANNLYDLGLRRVEDISITPTWLHLDCKEHNEMAILIVDKVKVTGKILIIKNNLKP